ncbi:hypothetical protein STVA_02630 [Allostella vacuolata]|nr:hypothetical protein STVA_02630 [Stella vacuolata]
MGAWPGSCVRGAIRYSCPGIMAASLHADPSQPAPSAARSLRILLVDDIALQRAMLELELAGDGHACDHAPDGEEAVRMARDGVYDLILMDRFMPGMDGLAATRRIRALPGPAGRTPIHGLTGDTGAAEIAACAEAGMDGVLEKPARAHELAALLATLTAGRPGIAADPAEPDRETWVRLRRSVGDTAFASLQRQFSAFAREKAAILRQAAAAGDTGTILRTAHMLAGTSGSFGHPGLGQEAQALQRAAHGDPPGASVVPAAERLARSATEAADRVDAALEAERRD